VRSAAATIAVRSGEGVPLTGVKPDGVAMAPGRVNLIGEHTDYNDGFVLPIAIDRSVKVEFRRRDDRVIFARTALRSMTCDMSLDDLEAHRGRGWGSYVAGVAWAIQNAGRTLGGADLSIESDVPSGAGLASSAALEVATHLALSAAAGLEWNATDAARESRRAENEFVGVACGVMDQMAAAASREGHAMLLDCRSLAVEYVPIPPEAAIVVMDTGVRRKLAASEYNERQGACERAVAQLGRACPGIRALRDVTLSQLMDARSAVGVTEFKRARHVIGENDRVMAAVDALRAGDLRAVGTQISASHDSLRDLYEVSSPALDAAVDCAMSHPACFGARMTGAGFGGCAVALVARGEADEFVRHLRARLPGAIPSCGEVFVVTAGAGARVETRRQLPL
jgi:galactokinase